MPAYVAEGRRVNGHVSIALVSKSIAAPASALLRSGTGIVLRSVRTFAPANDVTGSHDDYFVVAFTFTNQRSTAIAPRADQFVVQDALNRRFPGVVTGDPSLLGIVFDPRPLAPGASRTYTIGFRVPAATLGTLFYDSTR